MGGFAQQWCGRGHIRWIESGKASWLDIMKDIQWCTATKRLIREVTV
jgi:hypothetical protein